LREIRELGTQDKSVVDEGAKKEERPRIDDGVQGCGGAKRPASTFVCTFCYFVFLGLFQETLVFVLFKEIFKFTPFLVKFTPCSPGPGYA
jgi:hypothetical protein